MGQSDHHFNGILLSLYDVFTEGDCVHRWNSIGIVPKCFEKCASVFRFSFYLTVFIYAQNTRGWKSDLTTEITSAFVIYFVAV